MRLETSPSRRRARSASPEAGRAARAGQAGFGILEVLIGTVILIVGLIATAQILVASVQMHELARRTTDSARFAQDKFDELMKLDFATDPRIQINNPNPNPLTQNVNNYFDVPVAGTFTRRWRVQAGPTASTRLVTVRIVPTVTDLRMAKPVDITTVIRQW